MVQTKITIIAVLTIIFFLRIPYEPYGISSTSPWWTHFTYLFFHGDIIHLLCNSYALWFCLDKKRFSPKIIIPVYLITVAASFIISSPIPIIGISGAIFSIIGINLSAIPTKTNIIYTIIILATGFFVPHISGLTHLVCFIMGFISSVIYRNIKLFKNDYC